MYYWDSFFIIKGLLASKMYSTACGIIENIGYMIDKLVFFSISIIPNIFNHFEKNNVFFEI